ncbi:Type 1 glutamine amidotransferase-like domain-containing protein [Sphingobacterium sp. T2]|uniref:Type 1 glutamine amidotransferase-like domain-containing protein n=1 Tax=Sphingobacterium sp. T2 TaxID=1590596 RepID=UPI0009E4EBD3|nr:Type 1 glutamine amidotransferase-like domain-containing protein [Sphingobacterium sp. T2]
MKKLFLSSSFCDVAKYLTDFCGEELKGKTVTFIPTASLVEEYAGYVENDKNAFIELGIFVDVLNIEQKTEKEIAQILSQNDFIYVSGGNTFYLLQELKKSKADKLISEQIKNGKMYIGASAGSVILSKNIEYIEQVDDKTKAAELKNYSGLGLIDFYPLPHYGNEPFAEHIENIYKEYHNKIPLIPISNSQVIEFKNNEKTNKRVNKIKITAHNKVLPKARLNGFE